MGHIYKDSFFNYIDISSSRSAKKFIEMIDLPLNIQTILDIGCGRGAWIAKWEKSGRSVFGVDGEYIDLNNLLVSTENFKYQDISQDFDLNKKYDLVQCLEVAEHLAEKDSDTLVNNIVKHGDIVLFSAAVPGQGGEFHVNEQPLSYWVEKFKHHGYVCFDYIRPQISNEKSIEPWYRYNSLLFVKSEKANDLPEEIKLTQVTDTYNYNKFVSQLWIIRNGILKVLPAEIINIIAKLKHYTIALSK